jgi:hypothetical protein
MHLVPLSIPFFARCDDFAGQDGILRPIVNRPAGIARNAAGTPVQFAACRYVGQPILAAAGFQPALFAPRKVRKRR